MHFSKTSAPRNFLLVALFALLAPAPFSLGQQVSQSSPAAQEDEDVLRIRTELVQTDLMVFDKQGRFVEGLRPEQFELSLDGRKQTVSFFELVTSGSSSEASKLAAARAGSPRGGAPVKAEASGATDRGRVVFFFLDDLHLSEASLVRARRSLADFVENRMGENDQVAVVSASGQIGFLQQLTDYKPVLRAAIERLNNKRNTEAFAGRTVITEYQANQMAEHGDKDLFNYIVTSTINEFQLVSPKGGDKRGLDRLAINMVKNRNQQILAQSKAATTETLSVLESLMRSSAQLPGRKLVFFISDGFVADVRGGYALNMLQRITREAARVGAVVYTMDARGTYSDPAVDAGRNDFPDGMSTGTSARNISLEASAMREPLHILADETGGRAILNSNSFPDAFQQAINETSTYYLLAWRPESDDERSGKARIKVSIKDRPDLRVRLRRNYYVPPSAAESKEEKNTPASKAKQTPEAGLLTALGSIYPQRTIPTALSVGYLHTPDQGLVLKASMQMERGALNLSDDEKRKAEVDVIGAAVDDRGLIVTFKQLVTIAPDPSAQIQPRAVVWNQQLKLQPGLYQVRVAVRERGSGRTGSAQQWIEVPDLAAGRLQMSSLFLGERKMVASDEKLATAPRPIMVNVDHRFTRASVLRFQTYIYNAARGANAPDVEIQARVVRGDRVVVTTSPARVPTDTTKDLMRLPYWAEVALDQLPPGRYVLQVTATDRAAKTSVTQRVGFVVE
ncbi:MAG TPA: VWA domain-containing protein [Pyrinomonadaceae bacterium]